MAAKKAAGSRTSATKTATPKKASPKKASPKTAATKAAPAKKTAAKAAPAKKAAKPAKKAPGATKVTPEKATRTPAQAKTAAKAKSAKAQDTAEAPAKAPAKKSAAKPADTRPAAPPRLTTAGLDKAFLDEQRKELADLRAEYVAQAEEYESEADLLAQELETGDVGFDEEAGEGGAATVDRERNLVLAAKARQTAEEIDQAVRRIENGSYGLCLRCGQKIPKMRLKAIPHAELCVDCKAGGLLRRR